jgi:hypothetical protein
VKESLSKLMTFENLDPVREIFVGAGEQTVDNLGQPDFSCPAAMLARPSLSAFCWAEAFYTQSS